jgi:enediyne biosynthesis protein E4
LPLMAQLAPVNAIVATDADSDGKIDLMIAGNEYQSEIGTGRYDASFGQFLKNDGNGIFTTPPIQQSGLYIDGDVKNLNLLNTAHDERIIIAAVNNSFLKCIRINPVKNRIQQLN